MPLQKTVKRKEDQLVLMGDLNARVGGDKKAWLEWDQWRQGDETLKRNGQRVFCVLHELVILNTTFQHKEFHSEKGLKTRSSGCESG